MRGAAGVGERARWPQALPAGKRTEGLLLVRIGGSGPCRELEAGSIHRTSPFTHSRKFAALSSRQASEDAIISSGGKD
jgi:hypothetical protein